MEKDPLPRFYHTIIIVIVLLYIVISFTAFRYTLEPKQ